MDAQTIEFSAILNVPFATVKIGDHWVPRRSIPMRPSELILGWQIFVVNLMSGAVKGCELEKCISREKCHRYKERHSSTRMVTLESDSAIINIKIWVLLPALLQPYATVTLAMLGPTQLQKLDKDINLTGSSGTGLTEIPKVGFSAIVSHSAFGQRQFYAGRR